ncbi:MAG: hypothetical protein ACI8RT_000794 [Candidatus Azotimanducaceae bacterium]|jgi:hypothetical protein|tara:strand:- start:298 stop:1311 length:1014 start_codon:yes stop_codon:yes gene_type:complete
MARGLAATLMMAPLTALLTALLLGLVLPASANAVSKNGFDLSNSILASKHIKRGGPEKDGIFALTFPKFVPAKQSQLSGSERVLGVAINNTFRAYPIRYLNIHEVVNDRIDSQHFTVSFCPLCGSGVLFATNVNLLDKKPTHLNFGVSGLLYNSDLLMYDRNTQSLWSQISAEAISGPMVGSKLPTLPVWHTTWASWQQRHPQTQVMQGDARFANAYKSDPYPNYEKNRGLYFSVTNKAPRQFHPKEKVLGVTLDGISKAYPFIKLREYGKQCFTDDIAGQIIRIEWDDANNSAWITNTQGEPMNSLTSFWFAWFTFHPKTQIFEYVDNANLEACGR